jgi:peptidyl-prolyl cis-trans isomerase D
MVLVKLDFGFHIIKITDKQDGIRLATVAQKNRSFRSNFW